MKKCLLFMFAFVVAAISAFAGDVTVTWSASSDWKNEGGALSYTQDTYTILLEKAGGKSNPAINGNSNDARVYANGTVKVSTTGEGMTKIVFALSKQGLKRLPQIQVSAGTIEHSIEAKTVTWTGDAKEVIFTVGEHADLGSDGATKAGQFCFDNLTITTGGAGGGTDPTPDPEKPVLGEVFSEPFNVNLGEFVIEDTSKPGELEHVWSWGGQNYGAKASAYFNSTKYATESWLISPVIDLGKATNSVLNFEQAANFFTSQEHFQTACDVKVRVEGGEWADLAYTGEPTGKNWDFVESAADLKAYDGKKIQVAFRYTSTSEIAGTWEIKNFVVKAELSEAPVVVTPPVFSPEAGTYMDEVVVTLTAEAGNKIYYTLDGSVPTVSSTLYMDPFKLTANTKVIAIAVDAEGNVSANAVAEYKVKESPKVPENGVLLNFNENKWELPVSTDKETFEITEPLTEGPVTLAFTSGSTPTRLWNDFNNGIQLRIYKAGGSLTITAAKGYQIVMVDFDASKFEMVADKGTLEAMKWTGEADEVVFTANNTCNISYIIVTLSKTDAIGKVEAENGQQIIYSIDGRRLQQAEKGVNIINGKKVLVK